MRSWHSYASDSYDLLGDGSGHSPSGGDHYASLITPLIIHNCY
ncbi:MAG: hypothetical protein QF415_11030 [Candidatus Undinarchaeales archaeon]|nr:hypothetical protein [Candidatus Undinarchaeales archaeon]MDP7491479.1 hypothetical protein [Candidatus Undinarchaeales archaeon]